MIIMISDRLLISIDSKRDPRDFLLAAILECVTRGDCLMLSKCKTVQPFKEAFLFGRMHKKEM